MIFVQGLFFGFIRGLLYKLLCFLFNCLVASLLSIHQIFSMFYLVLSPLYFCIFYRYSALSARFYQSQDEGEAGKFLRVLLPDGSTTVMQVKSSDSLRSVLATLLNKKSSLPITSIEVFPLESDRVSY